MFHGRGSPGIKAGLLLFNLTSRPFIVLKKIRNKLKKGAGVFRFDGA